MRQFWRFVLPVAALVAVLVGVASTYADPVFPDGWEAYSIGAEADTFILNGDFKDTNYGNNTLLMGKYYSNDKEWSRKAYIRFDVRSEEFPIPNDFFQLTLNVVDSGTGSLTTVGENYNWKFNVYGFYGTGNEWSELPTGTYDPNDATTGITWNNAPLNDKDSGRLMEDGAELLGTFDIKGKGIGNVIAFRSDALNDFINDISDDEQYVNFVITRESPSFARNEYVHAFASSEYNLKDKSANPILNNDGYPVEGPYLTSIPEPATVMIWAVLGLLCVVSQRRGR